jgi:hypothetical protein
MLRRSSKNLNQKLKSIRTPRNTKVCRMKLERGMRMTISSTMLILRDMSSMRNS